MTEFDLILKLFRDNFKVPAQDDGSVILFEDKEAAGHRAQTIKTLRIAPVKEMAFFRFSLDKSDFLPFFKDSRDPENGPRHLKKFCDYVMLAHNDKLLNIALIELKRSKKDPDMPQQLMASELFMRYVVDTAQRIKHDNSCDDFNPERIIFKKICIKNDLTGRKLATSPKEKFQQTHSDDITTLHLARNFNPHWMFL